MNDNKVVVRATETDLSVTGPEGIAFSIPYSGDWASTTSAINRIQMDLSRILMRVGELTRERGVVVDDENYEIHLTVEKAKGIARCAEYRKYVLDSPDALAAITDLWNPHRGHGLTPYLYGFAVRVEGVRAPNPALLREVQEACHVISDLAPEEQPFVVSDSIACAEASYSQPIGEFLMSQPSTYFCCDAPSCRSFVQLHPADSKTAESAVKALRDRGWVVTTSEPRKHYCQSHRAFFELTPAPVEGYEHDSGED